MPKYSRCRRVQTSGFTLIEVTMALVVLLMMTLMFAAVFPIAVRGSKMSDNYAQAAQIAQHKIDQLRAAGFSSLNYTSLNGAGIVDTTASPPASLPATYHFESSDNLVNNGSNNGYYPPGSTGTVTIQDYYTYAVSKGITSGIPPAGAVDYITVTITWTGGGVQGGTYSASAMVIQMKHT